MDFAIFMLESTVKWNSTTGKSRLSWLRCSQDRQLEVSKNDTTWQQCHRKKKLVTEASDANDRLFRDSRPKESFLDDCHECHQRHWRKSKFLNSFFLFFQHTYITHIPYIHHIISHINHRGSIEKFRFFTQNLVLFFQ